MLFLQFLHDTDAFKDTVTSEDTKNLMFGISSFLKNRWANSYCIFNHHFIVHRNESFKTTENLKVMVQSGIKFLNERDQFWRETRN